MFKKMLVAVVSVLLMNHASHALLVLPGSVPGATILGSSLFQSFNNGPGFEIIQTTNAGQLTKDFDHGTTAQGTTPIGSWQNYNFIVVEYDKTRDVLRTTVMCNNTYVLEQINFSSTFAAGTPMNYMQIDMAAGSGNAGVNLNNAVLNGNWLGNFSASNSQFNSWYISGYDLSDGFTFTAMLNPVGSGKTDDKIIVSFGHVPEPATLAVLALGGMMFGRRMR